MVSLILGILMLIVGFYLYTQAAPQWQQAQSWLAQFASALSPGVRDQIQQIQITYFGSIALMILGGVMTVIGAVRVFSVRIRD